jgi:N-methylhydantoinase A
MVGRYHYLAPKIEVFSIGVAGGSVITLDPRTKVPSVGPRSAGARPGPVCYGLGGSEATLTDVMLLIGYLDPQAFLDGTVTLDTAAAREAFRTQIADPLGMSVEEAATGIYEIAAAQITDLLHRITVQRGLDPRDFVVHAFGGTCGLLAGTFAPELSVKRVVIPYTASVNCALGLVAADVVHEYSVTQLLPAPPPADAINALYAQMVERAIRELRSEGFSEEDMRLQWAIDLRYRRQVHEVTTPVSAPTPLSEAGVHRVMEDFERIYELKYGRGSTLRDADVEMTAFRLTARGLMPRPQLAKSSLESPCAAQAKLGERPALVRGKGMMRTPIYDFVKLRPNNLVQGPAIIQTPITTIVLQDRQTARLDAFRNVILEF